MTGTKICILFSLLAAGDVLMELAPSATVVTNFGALGVLAWVTWGQRNDLRDLRLEQVRIATQHAAIVDQMLSRWDGWEKIRHEDTDKLDGTLRAIVQNCAAFQGRDVIDKQ